MSDRNADIFERMTKGESADTLAKEYNISKTRVNQIFERVMKGYAVSTDPLYQAIYKAVEELGYNTSIMVPKIFNKLRRANITRLEDLDQLNPDEWKASRHVGPICIEVLEKIRRKNESSVELRECQSDNETGVRAGVDNLRVLR